MNISRRDKTLIVRGIESLTKGSIGNPQIDLRDVEVVEIDLSVTSSVDQDGVRELYALYTQLTYGRSPSPKFFRVVNASVGVKFMIQAPGHVFVFNFVDRQLVDNNQRYENT